MSELQIPAERNSEQSLREAVERLTALTANHDEIVSRAFSGVGSRRLSRRVGAGERDPFSGPQG